MRSKAARLMIVLVAAAVAALMTAGPAAAATSRSKTFGGFEATLTATRTVVAQFVVPAVTCPATGSRGMYAFAGQAASNHLSQRDAGVFIVCQNGSLQYIPTAFAGGNSNVNHTVTAGNHMQVQVSVAGSTVHVILRDLTRNWTQQVNGPAVAAPIAQIGLNDITINGATVGIPNFGQLQFSHVSVSGQTLKARPHTAVTKVNAANVVQAVPGAIAASGAAFSIAWKHG